MVPGFLSDGTSMWSIESRCMSVGRTPVAASNSSSDPMQRTSEKSSFAHSGMGVPQKREREMAQSRAPSSQLRKRAERTKSGTHIVLSLLTSSRSLIASTLTNHDGTAL